MIEKGRREMMKARVFVVILGLAIYKAVLVIFAI